MKILRLFEKQLYTAYGNRWYRWFYHFCRVILAFGFFPPGVQKIIGERFTDLSVNHPMGNFLDAFYHTGYYYPFVGWMQVLAAVLIIVPRTAWLGAMIYIPIILNITMLSFSVRFEGSFFTSPLMTCAALFVILWHYPLYKNAVVHLFRKDDFDKTTDLLSLQFPYKFFGVVVFALFLALAHSNFYDMMPRNTYDDCVKQCNDSNKEACLSFCACIHVEGKALNHCLE